jgi:hypothetical protein
MATDHEDVTTWLLLLERGRRTNDYELAGRAQAELRRLGVRVSYGRRTPRRRRKQEATTDA